MGLGLGSSLSKTGLVNPVAGIVTDSLVLKHNYAAGGVTPVSDGSAFFDGTDDYIAVGDAANLSFGDSSNDSAFSVSAWVNMNDATSFPIITKGIYNSSAEWQFKVETDDKLYLVLFDEDGANTYERARYDTALTSFEGQWIHVCATYNGVGGNSANGGISLYVNGAEVATNLAGDGAYTAMENLTHDVWIGRRNTVYADGYICNVGLWSAVLTQPQIKSIMWKNYADLTSSETTNLVSWWNLSADANDSHGSNNGTLS